MKYFITNVFAIMFLSLMVVGTAYAQNNNCDDGGASITDIEAISEGDNTLTVEYRILCDDPVFDGQGASSEPTLRVQVLNGNGDVHVTNTSNNNRTVKASTGASPSNTLRSGQNGNLDRGVLYQDQMEIDFDASDYPEGVELQFCLFAGQGNNSSDIICSIVFVDPPFDPPVITVNQTDISATYMAIDGLNNGLTAEGGDLSVTDGKVTADFKQDVEVSWENVLNTDVPLSISVQDLDLPDGSSISIVSNDVDVNEAGTFGNELLFSVILPDETGTATLTFKITNVDFFETPLTSTGNVVYSLSEDLVISPIPE